MQFFYQNLFLTFVVIAVVVFSLAFFVSSFEKKWSGKTKFILGSISVLAITALALLLTANGWFSHYEHKLQDSIASLGIGEAKILAHDDSFDIWDPELELQVLGQYESQGVTHVLMETNDGQHYVLHYAQGHDDENPFGKTKSVFKLSTNNREFTDEKSFDSQKLIDNMRFGIYDRATVRKEDRGIAFPNFNVYYAITRVQDFQGIDYKSVDKLVFVGTYPTEWWQKD